MEAGDTDRPYSLEDIVRVVDDGEAIAGLRLGDDGAMRAKDLVRAWVEAFNRADVEALAAFYADDAINHQVAQEPVEGRQAIREMFAADFARAEMVCVVENLFEDGE